MKQIVLLLALLPMIAGCFKNDLDPAGLHDNPFDADFDGGSIFTFDTTFIETVPADPPYVRQVFQFRVNSSWFLTPHSYQVYVHDQLTGATSYVQSPAAGSDVARYYRNEFTLGQEVCLEVGLSNNYHHGRLETICGTLQ